MLKRLRTQIDATGKDICNMNQDRTARQVPPIFNHDDRKTTQKSHRAHAVGKLIVVQPRSGLIPLPTV